MSWLWRRHQPDELDRLIAFFRKELPRGDWATIRWRAESNFEGASVGQKVVVLSMIGVMRRMAKELAEDPEEYADSLAWIRAEGLIRSDDLRPDDMFGGDFGVALAYYCLSACNADMHLGADAFIRLYRDLLPIAVVTRPPEP